MITMEQIAEKLENGALDEELSLLYCRPVSALSPYRERILHLMEGYRREFDRGEQDKAAIFSAPGRTELGGNHTDHQKGKVLTAAVDLDALACAAPNRSKCVRIYSEGFGLLTLDIGSLAAVSGEEGSSEALIRGILAAFAQRGYEVGGFDAYVSSRVPAGSGLSSSACFEVLIGVIVNHFFCDGQVSLEEIAKIGQYAENVYFGKPSGLLDQMGCALGGAVAIDFGGEDAPRITPVDFDFEKAGHVMCIVDTGADHADLTGDYAAIPAEMGAVASFFGKTVLSEVAEEEFYDEIPALRAAAGDRAVLRAIHYYDDCRRVERQTEALKNGDFAAYLALVKASGRSSFMYLQNVTTGRSAKAQPVAVVLAAAEHFLNGQGAFRIHGGGFAGTIQAYVPTEMVDTFRQKMDALLGEGACHIAYIRPVGGYVLCR